MSRERVQHVMQRRAALRWQQAGLDLREARRSLKKSPARAGFMAVQAGLNALIYVCEDAGAASPLPQHSPLEMLKHCQAHWTDFAQPQSAQPQSAQLQFAQLQAACQTLEAHTLHNPFTASQEEQQQAAQRAYQQARIIYDGVKHYQRQSGRHKGHVL